MVKTLGVEPTSQQDVAAPPKSTYVVSAKSWRRFGVKAAEKAAKLKANPQGWDNLAADFGLEVPPPPPTPPKAVTPPKPPAPAPAKLANRGPRGAKDAMKIVRKAAASGAMIARLANSVPPSTRRSPAEGEDRPARPPRPRAKNRMAVVHGARSVVAKKVVATSPREDVPERSELARTGPAGKTDRGAKSSLPARIALAAI